jgi:hypothetical protein
VLSASLRLEVNAEHELQFTGSTSPYWLPVERGADKSAFVRVTRTAGHRWRKHARGSSIVGDVEEIESFGTEAHTDPFCHRETLIDGSVELP